MDPKNVVTFSIFQFILNGRPFTVDDFSHIPQNTDLPYEIGHDLVSVDRVEVRIPDNRFVVLIFRFHERWPYSDKVLHKSGISILEEDNPRSNEQIEETGRLYVLLDSNKQRIYLSNRQKDSHLKDFFKKNGIGDYSIKPIIEEREFIENIESVKEIFFTVEKEKAFQQTGTLSKSLIDDIYGYDVDEASLSLKYKKDKPIEQVKAKIRNLVDGSNGYKNLTIVGRDSSDFEKVFNLDGVVSRITVKGTLLPNTKEMNIDDMLQSLMLTIIKHDRAI